MTDRFTYDELVALQSRLAEEQAETTKRIAGLTHDFDAIVASAEGSNADDEHDPEGQTIGFERAQVSALLSEAVARRADLERAWARLGAGTFGDCSTCGTEISFERLLAAPTTMTCITCANAVERSRRRTSRRGG